MSFSFRTPLRDLRSLVIESTRVRLVTLSEEYIVHFWKAKTRAQLFFMLMTAQPCFLNTNPVGLATNHQSRAWTP